MEDEALVDMCTNTEGDTVFRTAYWDDFAPQSLSCLTGCLLNPLTTVTGQAVLEIGVV